MLAVGEKRSKEVLFDSVSRPQQTARVGQPVEGRLEAGARLANARHFGQATIEKSAGVGKSRRTVLQPVEQCCSVNPREGGALGVETEIGRAVSGGVPDAVDRLVQQTDRQRCVLRE